MIKMIDVNERWVFTSALDKSEPKTEFVLRYLSSLEHGRSVMLYEDNQKIDSMFVAVKACLVEIKTGEKSIKEITDQVLESIPLPVVLELYNAIMERNLLSEQDGKN